MCRAPDQRNGSVPPAPSPPPRSRDRSSRSGSRSCPLEPSSGRCAEALWLNTRGSPPSSLVRSGSARRWRKGCRPSREACAEGSSSVSIHREHSVTRYTPRSPARAARRETEGRRDRGRDRSPSRRAPRIRARDPIGTRPGTALPRPDLPSRESTSTFPSRSPTSVAILAVPSGLPSSTTRTEASGRALRTCSRTFSIFAASLYVGSTTSTRTRAAYLALQTSHFGSRRAIRAAVGRRSEPRWRRSPHRWTDVRGRGVSRYPAPRPESRLPLEPPAERRRARQTWTRRSHPVRRRQGSRAGPRGDST